MPVTDPVYGCIHLAWLKGRGKKGASHDQPVGLKTALSKHLGPEDPDVYWRGDSPSQETPNIRLTHNLLYFERVSHCAAGVHREPCPFSIPNGSFREILSLYPSPDGYSIFGADRLAQSAEFAEFGFPPGKTVLHGHGAIGADRTLRATHAFDPVDLHCHGLPRDLSFRHKPCVFFRVVDMGHGNPLDILDALITFSRHEAFQSIHHIGKHLGSVTHGSRHHLDHRRPAHQA
jgi:hypothetical protein